MKTRTKIAASIAATPLLAIVVYFCTAYLLLLFPVNSTPSQLSNTASIEAFVMSNGPHTDLVFPVRSSAFDWTRTFPLKDFLAPAHEPAYIAIGWGDREFYLNTKELSDITPARAFGALSGGHRSLVHVDYLPHLRLGVGLYKLQLTTQQYASLINYVHQTLVLSPSGTGIPIVGRHYGTHDAFYDARGSYSLFNTCNTWTGIGLRQAVIKVSRWTPLAPMVVWHLEPQPR